MLLKPGINICKCKQEFCRISASSLIDKLWLFGDLDFEEFMKAVEKNLHTKLPLHG